MNDIYDIKNILTAFTYIRKDTWYIIGIGIIIYLIFLFSLTVFERYYKLLHEQHSLQNKNEDISDTLSNLTLDDDKFFQKISFAVRTHLEQTGQISGAITKAPQEIYKHISSNSLKKILDTCVFYEYTAQEATLAQKRIIKGLAREFLVKKII